MEKRPGCDAVYYIYDKGERLVFSQDGEQRGRGEWTFTIPDVFGRTLLKGVCKNMFYYDDYPFINIVTEAKRTNASNNLYGHTVSGVTLNNATLHGVNFYDDYAFIGKKRRPDFIELFHSPFWLRHPLYRRLQGVVDGYGYGKTGCVGCGRIRLHGLLLR